MFSMFGDEEPSIDEAQGSDNRRAIYMQALQLIDREESLIHYRMSWGLQWNFATFAILVALQNTTLPPGAKSAIDIILTAFGIAICLISFVAVMAAHAQAWFVMRSLCAALNVTSREWKNEFIRPYGHEKSVHRPARWLSKYIFMVIIALWLALLYAILFYGWSITFALRPPT